jgi:hypothetical protein
MKFHKIFGKARGGPRPGTQGRGPPALSGAAGGADPETGKKLHKSGRVFRIQ